MRERLKVLTITETLHIGGDETRILNFARFLDRSRFDHSILVMSRPDASGDARHGPIAPLFEEAGVRVRSLGQNRRGLDTGAQRRDAATLANSLIHGPALLSRLMHEIRQERPDALDLRKHYAISWAALAGRLAGTPVITGIDYYAERLHPRARHLVATAAFRLLDAFVSDASYTVERYEQLLPFLRGRTRVIPNGVWQPRPALSRDHMLGLFGITAPAGVAVFGQIARLVPFKGQLVLLDAARLVLDARPASAAFIICGHAPLDGFYRELYAKRTALGLDRHVGIAAYPGPSDDFWAAVDIHVHASLLDSSPIAIHEAMATGLPTVATSVGGVPELIAHDESGLLVPPGNPEALAGAMIRLIDDRNLATKLGQMARLRYEADHMPSIMAERTCALFEALIAKRRAHGKGATA